ncbi:unnamed protein product [Spirodela intermedia]|uniref:Uncharacterized protein n=1 Tax=Spirodela intermedia TaxID=51605 RepID=A0A7I8K5M7_SPIIN|nr:unnamed protein product [Spirodela intermedia]
MFPVFRAARCPLPLPYFFSSTAAGRTTATSQSIKAPPTPQKPMETMKPEEEEEKTSDAMSESFGVAYSTRSDEEGFGGTFSHRQSLPPPPQDTAADAGREELQAREAEEGRKEEEKAAPAPA